MMGTLKAVKPKTMEPKKPKILIFGKAGVGKSFGALGFPNSYYMDTEAGAERSQYQEQLTKSHGLYFGKEQGSQDFKTVIEEFKSLATIKNDRKAVILDSISKLFNVVIGHEIERLGDKDTFGASKKPAVSLTRSLMNWIDKIDMTVIMVAHEKILWSDQKQIGTTFDAWDKLEYELDLCLNIVKMGDSRKAFVKKSRLTQFPEGSSFDWNYAEFSKLYGKDIIEKEAKPIILATSEQLKEVERLLGIVKLGDTKKDKWITDNKEDFKETEQHIIVDIIKYLNEKINPTEDKEKPPFLKNVKEA